MREQLQNERDNAAAYGDTDRVAKLNRLLGAGQKRAAAMEDDRKELPRVRVKPDQRRRASDG